MKTSKIFQHGDLDSAILHAQNSLCGLINEIAAIAKNPVDAFVFVFLNNDVVHKIAEIEQNSILNSTTAAKKLFIDEVITALTGELDKSKSSKRIDAEIQALIGRVSQLGSTDPQKYNETIQKLFEVIRDYSKAVALDLAIKNAEVSATKVANTFAGKEQELTTLKDAYYKEYQDVLDKANKEKRAITDQEISALLIKKTEFEQNNAVISQLKLEILATAGEGLQEVYKNVQLWTVEGADQQRINTTFLTTFEAQHHKALIDYFKNSKVPKEVEQYQTQPGQLINCSGAAYESMCNVICESLPEDLQNDLKAHLNKLKSAKNEQTSAIKAEIIKFYKDLATKSDSAQDVAKTTIDALEATKVDIQNRVQLLPPEVLAEITKQLQQEINFSWLPPETLGGASTQEFVANVPKTIDAFSATFKKVEESKQTLSGLIGLIKQKYDLGIQASDSKEIGQYMTSLVNDIPHAINAILPPEKQTTGSSRFF